MDANNVLEIRGLNVEFASERGRLRALRDVDLTIPRGSIVGVVGESGCGKSTMINSIIGLLAHNATVSSGSISFQGEDLLQKSERELRDIRGQHISMIFQDPMTTLNPVLSIGTQMIDIQYRDQIPKAQKKARSIEMLSRVGIPDPESRLDNYPHQFSGGMRQRIAIAMALQAEPELLIADEPTTALDATLEVQIIHRLKDLQHSMGCSILFISHHLGVIAELCDFVIVMYGGEVVERGTVRDIFHRPSHPYTFKLLECDPARIAETTRSLPTIPGEIPNLAKLPPGCIFADRCERSIGLCREKIPPSTEFAEHHWARCHLAGEVSST
ncbi:MAG: ABC transporter ATP-binding protein [Gammaproteobacteria bacterium]|nr:MAG: ABC transporter ATP-binding protein [Gammaproteobacteria bacterium]UCH41363.1 MAG: ABC transporter ATP-binding protein [Gammaproteobacteria bacterium]